MLRLYLKYPYHRLTPFQRYETPRLLVASCRYSQKPCPDPKASESSKQDGSKTSGGGGSGLFYTFGLITVATGATFAYAKYDPEFRRWLGDKAPWTDSVIAFVFQEDRSISEAFSNTLKKLEEGLHKSIAGLKNATLKKTPEDAATEAAQKCLEEKKERPEYTPPRSVFTSLLNQTPPEPEKTWSEVRVLPEPTDGTQPNTEIVSTDRESAEDLSSLPPTHPMNLAELEKSIQESACTAIKAYREAACAAKEASMDVLKLIDQSVHETDSHAISKIKGKFDKKSALIKEAENRAQNATLNICKLRDILESSMAEVPAQHRELALRNAERVLGEISEAEAELAVAKEESGATEEYARKVEAARKHYIDEMLILFPDMRPSDREWRISKHDLDLFVYYCFQNVLYYQKELAKMETMGNKHLKSSLVSNEITDRNVDNTMDEALAMQARELELDFQKRILEIKQSTEKDMRLQLKRQAEAHNDHLNDVISVKEKELARKHQRQEEEKLASEQEKFKHQLAGLVGRLQGLESALKARSQIDKGAHQAQVLWSACQALDSALKHFEPGVAWTKQLRPLETQINAVRKAALEDDELVIAVLDGIPEKARRRGVFSEGALRERFLSVEKAARSVALVPYEGAPLPIYFLSYLQSALLIKTLNPIPQAELKNEPSNLDNLDTYDILQRSRYWMERGNIEQAVRYMNLLTGASRAVAKDWIDEARVYLETKQAATVLMTHAAAAGLLYI